MPVNFELNQGQAPATYRYVAHNIGGEVRFTDSGPDILVNGKTGRVIIRLRSVGMSAETRAEGKLPLQARTNYLIGRDASRWIRNVSTFAEVAYDGIYPGVDLFFYGSKDQLEHDFIVSPHSDPAVIRFTLTGAEQLQLNDSGDLVASAAGEKIIFQRPVAYQEIDGKKIAVKSAFRLDSSHPASSPVVSFELGRYDPERQLIIDPVLSFSTYVTGSGTDQVAAVTTDALAISISPGPLVRQIFLRKMLNSLNWDAVLLRLPDARTFSLLSWTQPGTPCSIRRISAARIRILGRQSRWMPVETSSLPASVCLRTFPTLERSPRSRVRPTTTAIFWHLSNQMDLR